MKRKILKLSSFAFGLGLTLSLFTLSNQKVYASESASLDTSGVLTGTSDWTPLSFFSSNLAGGDVIEGKIGNVVVNFTNVEHDVEEKFNFSVEVPKTDEYSTPTIYLDDYYGNGYDNIDTIELLPNQHVELFFPSDFELEEIGTVGLCYPKLVGYSYGNLDFSTMTYDVFTDSITSASDLEGDGSSWKLTVAPYTPVVQSNLINPYIHVMGYSNTLNGTVDYYIYFDIGGFVDVNSPEIEGTMTIVSPASDPYTIDEMKAMFVATDDVDGNITSKLEFNFGDYSPQNVISNCTYEVDCSVSVSDSAGNKTTKNFVIVAHDDIAPRLTCFSNNPHTEHVNIDYYHIWNPVDDFEFWDNCTNGECEQDLIDRLRKTQDDYIESKDMVGTYIMRYETSDSSGNVCELVIHMVVEDNYAPVVVGQANYEVENTKLYTLDEIYSWFTITDHQSFTYDFSGYDAYKNNYPKGGKYPMALKVTDKSGNVATFNFTITSKDVVNPVIFVLKDAVIVTPKTTKLSDDQVISLLSSTYNLENNPIETCSSDYFDLTEEELEKIEEAEYDCLLTFADGQECTIKLKVSNTKTNIFDSIVDSWNNMTGFQKALGLMGGLLGLAAVVGLVVIIIKKIKK